MAIPFPATPPVLPATPYSPKSAFRGASPPTTITWLDEGRLIQHVASVTSNNGSTLVISSNSTSYTYDLTGDGTQCIPVGVLTTP